MHSGSSICICAYGLTSIPTTSCVTRVLRKTSGIVLNVMNHDIELVPTDSQPCFHICKVESLNDKETREGMTRLLYLADGPRSTDSSEDRVRLCFADKGERPHPRSAHQFLLKHLFTNGITGVGGNVRPLCGIALGVVGSCSQYPRHKAGQNVVCERKERV